MKMESEIIQGDITKISLDGRLDVEGTEAIDMKFTALTATKKAAVVVDMSQVSFIASIGMRTLLSSAKAQANRGGKIALANLQPLVKEALDTAGISSLIPMFDDMESAIAEVSGAA